MKAFHRLQIIPQLWQQSKGIFLAKPGKADYNNPKSYRTITLTSTLLKIQERCILWHLEHDIGIVDKHNKKQFGFNKFYYGGYVGNLIECYYSGCTWHASCYHF